MKNILIMMWFTLREALARKVFIFFIVISSLVILGMLLILTSKSTTVIIQTFGKSGQAIGYTQVIHALELIIVSPLSGLCILLAIFASSSFVPIMLEKGNIDLLLSKPVSRIQLLLGKYFGGVLVVFLNIIFLIIGVWLLISIKFSFWDFSFLWIIVIVTFTFAVLYSLIVLFGVMTQSSIFGMMIAYFIFIILSPLLVLIKDKFIVFLQNGFLKDIIIGLYYIVPQTAELMGETVSNLTVGKGIIDFQPILTSSAFLIITLALSVYLFVKKDF
ncbi:MAG TPA: hypothetical protein ENI61_02275 [Ignavibacteria bacterium]|nr:hypothetical protein [Ignavibacteria bacterium]